jgi:hypothetical protein
VAVGARHPGRDSRAGAERDLPVLLACVLLAALLVVVVAVALLPTDPRLAIAGAVSLSNLGIAVVAINHDSSLVAILFVAAAPMVVAVAVTRTRRLAHAPI